MPRNELPAGVYGLKIKSFNVRKLSGSGHSVVMVKAQVLQPLAHASRNLMFALRLGEYSLPYLKELYEAAGVKPDDEAATTGWLSQLPGKDFVAELSYPERFFGRRPYLHVQPLLKAPDNTFKRPSVAKAEWEAVQASYPEAMKDAVIPAGCTVGTKSGRWSADQPNQANTPKASVYCTCANPQPKHVTFDTFEYDKCEVCGKEIQ